MDLPAPPADRGDLELRDRLVAGDADAADELVARHLEGLHAFVHWRVGGDRDAAEDLVQETVLAAIRDIDRFDGRASLEAWLRGIARNRIRAHRRRRRPAAIEDVLADADDEIDAVLADVAREPLPEWVLERRETSELVGATLSSLPADYRDALVGKYVDGLSTADLARRRGRSAKATESTLHRARLAFARVFELVARRRGGLG